MSKERLEEIRNRMIVEKQHFKYLSSEKGYWENVYTLLEHDMKYLFDTIIEQNERVEELEEKHKEYVSFTESNNYNMDVEFEKLYKQNKRYREAIENVLEIENYGVATDYIKTVTNILLEALEGSK